MTEPAFVAADWGTSSLRLWLMAANGEVLAEARSGEGMEQVSERGFEATLRARLADLGEVVDALANPLPIVLCGMVGARQGWREAGYLDVPVALTDLADRAVAVDALGLDARILPGLCRRDADRPDVMRGEETQLLGLLLHDPEASGVVCMPGTHSKWVTLDAGRVADFGTVMTGELFGLLSGTSILRHAIGGAAATGDARSEAFRAGLADGLADPGATVANLFSIRARSLLFGVIGPEAADRLSGLLIGSEIASRPGEGTVRLVASGHLALLYGAAFEFAGRPFVTVDADEAVRAGLLHAAGRLWPARVSRNIVA